MNTDDMAKALAATGSGTVVLANMSTASGLTIAAAGAPAIIVGVGAAVALAAVGYGTYVGYDMLKKKLSE